MFFLLLAFSSSLGVAASTQPPPDRLGLDRFYQKYVNCGGIPIVSSSAVADAALFKACSITDKMLGLRPDLRQRMVSMNARIAVMGRDERTTQIPEFRSFDRSYDTRTRGLGAIPSQPVTLVAEENLLCLSGDVYGPDNVFIHELGHSIFNLALRGSRDFLAVLVAWAFSSSLSANRWEKTFAITNVDEYWAELTQVWFGANAPVSWPLHNDIDTRRELMKYDPAMYEILLTVYPNDSWSFTCD